MGKKEGLFRKIWNAPYGFSTPYQLFDAAKSSEIFIQKLRLQIKLPVHNGCVNSICWNDNGDYILSGSDDQHLCITHGYKHNVMASVQTGHRSNIFSAKFLPNTSDMHVVSCSGDGTIIFSILDDASSSMSNVFNCHFGTTYEILTVPNDSNTFLSCGEDGTVRWFDLRIKNSCSLQDCKEDILINCQCAVTSLAINPLTPYQLGVGCADASVRIFDRRMLGTRATGHYVGSGMPALITNFTVPEFNGLSHRITSLNYSPDGKEMLVSYSSDYIYLFEVKEDYQKSVKVLSSRSSKKSLMNKVHMKLPQRPKLKRLRVRGDWSDTGPNARPEIETRGEQEAQHPVLQSNFMQRMSDVLTRMLNRSSQTQQTTASSSSEYISSSSESDENSSSGSNTQGSETLNESTEVKMAASDAESSCPSQSEGKEEREQDVKYLARDLSNTNCNEIDPESEAESANNAHSVQNISHCKGNFETSEMSTNHRRGEETHLFGAVKRTKTNSETEYTEQNMVLDELQEDCCGAEALDLSLQTSHNKLPSHSKDQNETDNEDLSNKSHIDENVNNGLVFEVPGTNKQQYFNESPLQKQSHCSNKRDQAVESSSVNSNSLISGAASSEDCALNLTSDENEFKEDRTQTCSENTNHKEERGGMNENSMAVQSESEDTNNFDRTNRSSESLQDDNEPRMLFNVDSWIIDSNSDDDQILNIQRRASTSQPRSSSPIIPESILRSVDEELKWQLEDRHLDKFHMLHLPQPRVKCKYSGHRNARTMIKESTFWGNNFIMSGSDCGHIFIWNRYTAELVMLMEADHHVVNCLQPHPFDPILASSGIDYDIKLWAPLREEPFFDKAKAKEIISRNEIMLEETKDTITVPASFMIRMLASLNHLRSAELGTQE